MDRQTDILSCVLQMGQELDQGRAQALKVRVWGGCSPLSPLPKGSLSTAVSQGFGWSGSPFVPLSSLP